MLTESSCKTDGGGGEIHLSNLRGGEDMLDLSQDLPVPATVKRDDLLDLFGDLPLPHGDEMLDLSEDLTVPVCVCVCVCDYCIEVVKTRGRVYLCWCLFVLVGKFTKKAGAGTADSSRRRSA
jgi:hypothetical protein